MVKCYHHHHQFILETQNRRMSENTEQNNKTCVPRVRKAATALTTAHITKVAGYNKTEQI